jgi:hypothetical protein
MTKQLIQSFAVISLAAASVYAQQRVKAQIPFSFHVGDSVLPSGSYTADTIAAGRALLLKSADGKSSAMALSSSVQSPTGPTAAKLIFHGYGNEYFLFQIWTGGEDTGRELLKTRREKELAAEAKRSIQTVLAER